MTYFSVFLSSLFVAMMLVAILSRYAVRLRLVDVPDERKVHTGTIPRIGGVGMVLGAVVAILAWMDLDREILAFVSGILIIAGFGIWDDRTDLDYRLKFLGQALAVIVVIVPGAAIIDRLSFDLLDPLGPWLAIPLTFLFLLGTTNALNLADGLDGLAAGVSLLSLAGIVTLGFLGEGLRAPGLALAMAGATLGFLRYNSHPAVVFMGDTGSQFLGFGLGVLAIWLTQKTNTALAPELPLLLVGLPIVDTLSVMGSRILRGKSPFKPDKNHFHHKLLDVGFDHYEAVVVIYVIQALFVASAYFMRYESAWTILAFFGLFAAVLVLFHPIATHFNLKIRRFETNGQISRFSRDLRGLLSSTWALRLPRYSIAGMLILFFGAGMFLARQPSIEVGIIAIAGLFIATIGRLLPAPLVTVAERLVVYTCAILVTYLLSGGALSDWPRLLHYSPAFFVALALMLALGVRVAGRDYFTLTPSDFLVLFILVGAAMLPNFKQSQYTRLAMESAVVLYAVEFVLRRTGRLSVSLWGIAIIVFLILSVRTFA